MSLVVSQTLPWSVMDLHFEDSTRWAHLLPLMRPSVKTVVTSSGQTIMIDTALARSKNTLIAAIGSTGNFSGKILGNSQVAAFQLQSSERELLAEEVFEVLQNSSFPVENGVVLLSAASKQDFRTFPGGIEVAVVGQLAFDHVLSLLSTSEAKTRLTALRSSFEKTQVLLQSFLEGSVTTVSMFHEKKTSNGPSVVHASEFSEFNSAKLAIDRDLSDLLSSRPAPEARTVSSVHYADINGLSRLENNIVAHEISRYLAKKSLLSYITQSTILDSQSPSRGWAISLCTISEDLLCAQTTPSNTLVSSPSLTASTEPHAQASTLHFSDSQVRRIVSAGCESVIKHESTITEYDTIVGDGDCGFTLRDGAKQVLHFISTADLSTLPSTLSALVDDLEVNMGGTSGALYCIFLSSLAQELWTASSFAEGLKGALEHLLKYTRARLGDRTCLDCLIPFVETLLRTGSQTEALKDAEQGVESTKKLEAKLGRSSYLDGATTTGVPDPGAYGLLKVLEGMVTES